MAYHKLNQELIDKFIDELKFNIQMQCQLLFATFGMDIGPLPRTFSLREICKKVGISHTTFYRWIKEYHALANHTEKLTDRERLLRAFGDAIEKMYSNLAEYEKRWTVKATPHTLMDYPENDKQHNETGDTDRREDNTDAARWEALTDKLTGGTRCVEFNTQNFTKKHVNDKII